MCPIPGTACAGSPPARIALGRAGGSLPTAAQLDFQLAHARARDAVHDALDLSALVAELDRLGLGALVARSGAGDRLAYLQRSDLGRRLDPASRDRLGAAAAGSCDAVFVVADGLSARAAHRHAAPLLTVLVPAYPAAAGTLGYLMEEAKRRRISGVSLKDEAGMLRP